MKTKTILLAGLIGAASALSSMAQVYSVNVVGFVNVTCPTGFSMIANPLVGSSSTVAGLLGTSVPVGTKVYKFDPTGATLGGFNVNIFTGSSWTDQNMTLNPGEGVFIKNSTASSFTVTFVGTVQTGALSLPLSAGFSIISSQTPQAGLLDDASANGLNFPLANGDKFYFSNPNAVGGYDTYIFASPNWFGPNGNGGIGSSAAPQVAVGQSFWVKKATGTTWSRTFATQ